MQKTLIRLASQIAPRQVSNFAYKQLLNPQVHKLRDFELAVLAQAQKETIAFQGFDIATYVWPGGPRKILLIHGWEGQAGNFGDIIKALREADFTVLAFDAPSHGFSSKGKTSLFEFTDLVKYLIQLHGVKDLISHSFGGVATTYALSQLPEIFIATYLLLTTPDRFTERIDDVSSQVGITEEVKNLLKQRLAAETGYDPQVLNVSDFVKQINVKEGLIIHDKNDRVIPIDRAKNVVKNWPVGKMEEIEGTGHFRILREEKVIKRILQFLEA